MRKDIVLSSKWDYARMSAPNKDVSGIRHGKSFGSVVGPGRNPISKRFPLPSPAPSNLECGKYTVAVHNVWRLEVSKTQDNQLINVHVGGNLADEVFDEVASSCQLSRCCDSRGNHIDRKMPRTTKVPLANAVLFPHRNSV